MPFSGLPTKDIKYTMVKDQGPESTNGIGYHLKMNMNRAKNTIQGSRWNITTYTNSNNLIRT